MAIALRLFKEKEALQFINDVASLRITLFREYPYLYDGSLEYEQKYLNKFVNTPDSIICIAFEDDKVIGALTGLPLSYEDPSIRKPWSVSNIHLNNIFYFSEALLLPEYRGKGLGKKLINLAEMWVINSQKYVSITLATVIRENDHPMKPSNYESLDSLWQARGFQPTKNMICHIPWKEINENIETEKPMQFWHKSIDFND